MKKLIVLLSLFLFLSFASAVSIFDEGFESGILSGWELSSAWNGTNWTAMQNDSNYGVWHAESNPQDTHIEVSNIEKSISTIGYQNISVSYFRKLTGLDSGDSFRVKWFNGNNWTYLENTENVTDSNYIYRYFSLPSSAVNNSNFKVRFECSADAQNEYCKLDDVSVQGDAISAGTNVSSGNYQGHFNYMPGYVYGFFINASNINNSNNYITFSGLNQSNQGSYHSAQLDILNRFVKRINYVWFYGWFNSQNLYVNQYVGTGNIYSAPAMVGFPGSYYALVNLTNVPYFGQFSSVQVYMNSISNLSTIVPVGYSSLYTVSSIDSVWQTAAHVYDPILLQTRIVQNANQTNIEVELWVKEDLAYNGMIPRWTSPLWSA